MGAHSGQAFSRGQIRKASVRSTQDHLQEMHLSGRAGEYEVQSTGISNFQFKHFLEAEKVRLLSLDEQRRIAWGLGSLDDKIELNRRIAETLERIAAAIFRAHFVDFVGVEEFEDSELGPIPKGWEVVPVGEAPSRHQSTHNRCWHRGDQLRSPAAGNDPSLVASPNWIPGDREDPDRSKPGVGCLRAVP
jgi:hypothetical protein